MLDSECIVGAEVVCHDTKDIYYGTVGHIGTVIRDPNNLVIKYTINNFYGFQIGCIDYYDLNKWDIFISKTYITGTTAHLTGFKINSKRCEEVIKPVSKPLSKECPCGIFRENCIYHNEVNR